MSPAIDLTTLSRDLDYASGAGAARVAASVVAAGKVEAATGVGGLDMPGPMLQRIAARATGRAGASGFGDAAQVPEVANHAAARAGRLGATLITEGRT